MRTAAEDGGEIGDQYRRALHIDRGRVVRGRAIINVGADDAIRAQIERLADQDRFRDCLALVDLERHAGVLVDRAEHVGNALADFVEKACTDCHVGRDQADGPVCIAVRQDANGERREKRQPRFDIGLELFPFSAEPGAGVFPELTAAVVA